MTNRLWSLGQKWSRAVFFCGYNEFMTVNVWDTSEKNLEEKWEHNPVYTPSPGTQEWAREGRCWEHLCVLRASQSRILTSSGDGLPLWFISLVCPCSFCLTSFSEQRTISLLKIKHMNNTYLFLRQQFLKEWAYGGWRRGSGGARAVHGHEAQPHGTSDHTGCSHWPRTLCFSSSENYSEAKWMWNEYGLEIRTLVVGAVSA